MRILFIDGTASFHPMRLSTKPAGGIVTSLSTIPKYLASSGHEAYVVSICEEEIFAGGVWYTRDKEKFADPDVVVFNRNTITNELVSCFPNSRIVLWLHDIVDPRYFDDNGFEKADVYVALSRYCKESYEDFYSLPPEKFVIIPNGVDPKVFYKSGKKRNKNLWITASAPIKGFAPIDYWYFNMKRHNPDLELRMYCSSKLHELNEEPKTAEALDKLKAKGITVAEPIPQHELAEVFREAYALLMPNSYPEICSNVLLQAQACGLPVIATNLGSADEFIEHEHNGLLTTTAPHDQFWWWKEFVSLSVKLYLNEEQHKHISRHAPLGVSTWNYIGARWNETLLDLAEAAGLMSGTGIYNKYAPNTEFGGKRVLNIGCGFEQFKAPNVTNVDAYDICDPDLVWDLNVTPLPFEDNTFDFIIANHILEHVQEWWPLFNECARILKPNGKMEVWLPGDGADGQLGYRDHVHLINSCSFFGIFQNYRYGGNAYAEAVSECNANRMKLVKKVHRMEWYWWIRYAPQSLVNWMGTHLRNVIAEQGFAFRKITDEEWANEQATRDKRRAYQNAQVLSLPKIAISK